MAATYTYGVAADDVAAEIPGVDDSSIGAGTSPVSTGDLTNWINDAAAKLNAMLDGAGIVASASMDADAHDALASAVKSYAVFKTMSVMGLSGPTLDNARDVWNTQLAAYSNRPQVLGAAYSDGLTTSIDTVETSDNWGFIDSEGSIW